MKIVQRDSMIVFAIQISWKLNDSRGIVEEEYLVIILG